MKIPSTLVLLGEPAEIETETGEIWEFGRGKFYLAATMSGKVELWILPTPKKKIFVRTIPTRAANLFKKFVGWHPEKAFRFETTDFGPREFGRAVSIAYRSNKWSGKKTGYIHNFSNSVKIQIDNVRNPSVWRLTGRKIKIRAEGIVG